MTLSVTPLDGNGESLAEMVRKLRHCRFQVGSGAKRFVRQLSFYVEQGKDLDAELTGRQKEFLRTLRHQYRKQIDRLTS